METGHLNIPGLNQAVLGILDKLYEIEKITIGAKSNGEINNFSGKNGLFIPHQIYKYSDESKIYPENVDLLDISDANFKLNLKLKDYKLLKIYISPAITESGLASNLVIVNVCINNKDFETSYGYIGNSLDYPISGSSDLIRTQLIIKDNKLCFLNMKSESGEVFKEAYIVQVDAYY